MGEHDAGRVGAAGLSEPDIESPDLHVASPADVTEATAREDRLDDILRRADVRDRAAEVRDREAESRDPGEGDLQAAVDRDWAGRDRDRAAEDRADLLTLLRLPSTDPGDSDQPAQ
jgi:hypothetical protein